MNHPTTIAELPQHTRGSVPTTVGHQGVKLEVLAEPNDGEPYITHVQLSGRWVPADWLSEDLLAALEASLAEDDDEPAPHQLDRLEVAA